HFSNQHGTAHSSLPQSKPSRLILQTLFRTPPRVPALLWCNLWLEGGFLFLDTTRASSMLDYGDSSFNSNRIRQTVSKREFSAQVKSPESICWGQRWCL